MKPILTVPPAAVAPPPSAPPSADELLHPAAPNANRAMAAAALAARVNLIDNLSSFDDVADVGARDAESLFTREVSRDGA